MNSKQLAKIFKLCLEINPTNTSKEVTGDRPTLFCKFGGHTGYFSVTVYPTGWSEKRIEQHYTYRTYNGRGWEKAESGTIKKVTAGQVLADLQSIKHQFKCDDK